MKHDRVVMFPRITTEVRIMRTCAISGCKSATGDPQQLFCPVHSLGAQVDYGDAVNPKHYMSAGRVMQAIDVIDGYGLNFNLGNVIKYVLRAGRKPNESAEIALHKAHYYITRELKRIGAWPE